MCLGALRSCLSRLYIQGLGHEGTRCRVSLVAVCLLQAILVLSTQQTKAASVHASASPAVPMRPWQGRVARREVEGIGSFLREAPGPYEPEASL